MIDSHELRRRDSYLNKLIGFQDTEPVKVITGIRRCGKSSLLKLMVQHLKDTGVLPEQIIEMNFESFDFHKMSADDVYRYVKERIIAGKRMYLFFDELQRIKAWEDAVNAFRVDFDCDIYVTGSNAYLLSSEYATYLSGRCVEIKMLPLSFREFLDFHGFDVRETQSALGGLRKQVFDKNNERYELREVFAAYMRFGGMPGIADVGLEQEKVLALLDGIYSTVVIRDILERETRRGQKQITDPALLRKIILFLADNIGSSVSIASIGNILVNEGLLDDDKRKGIPSAHTVQAYVNALLESYFFNRTDNRNTSQSDRQTFTSTDKLVLYNDENRSKTLNLNHRFNSRIDYKFSDRHSVMMRTSFSLQDNNSRNELRSRTDNKFSDDDIRFVYRRRNFGHNNSDGYNVSNHQIGRASCRERV